MPVLRVKLLPDHLAWSTAMDVWMTAADRLKGGKAWNVVGHTYTAKLHGRSVFLWDTHIPAGTVGFLPPTAAGWGP